MHRDIPFAFVISPSNLESKVLVTLDQTIAVLGNSTPHRHKVLDLIECRDSAYLVGITPHTHDFTLDTMMLLLYLMVKGDINAPLGVPFSAVQIHTLSLIATTWFHDCRLIACITDGEVCEGV